MSTLTKAITKKEDPIIMDVSIFSNIAHRLNFLAQAIKDQKDAESQNIYMECYIEEREVKGEKQDVKIIRFSTDLFLWTEIHPVDDIEGKILNQNIAVNLYDLYNVVENISQKDDIISFWIDKNELVINGFYNELEEFNELEVRLKINKIGFPKRKFPSVENMGVQLTSFELDNISLHSILSMNKENRTDGVNVVFENKKMRFQTDYYGFKTSMIIKQYQDQIFFRDLNVFIPFYVLNLMAGTGQSIPIKFNVYEEYIVVETDEYEFAYKIEKRVNEFEISDKKTKDFFVADPENVKYSVLLLNRINKPSPISTITIEKINDSTADMHLQYGERYSASVAVKMAMLSDKSIEIDSDLFEAIFTNTSVDAIKAKYFFNNKNLYIKYVNALVEIEMLYDHKKFLNYRKELASKNR